MELTITFFGGVNHGAWCDACALPSVVTRAAALVPQSKPAPEAPLFVLRWCPDCGHKSKVLI
jgi:hypothetical protein